MDNKSKNDLANVGGWLKFIVIIFTILVPLLTISTAVHATTSIGLNSELDKALLAIVWISSLITVALSIIAGRRLVARHSMASVRFAIKVLWFNGPILGALSAFTIFLVLRQYGVEQIFPKLVAQTGKDIIFTSLSALIWTLYLKYSKRVKNTYGGGNENQFLNGIEVIDLGEKEAGLSAPELLPLKVNEHKICERITQELEVEGVNEAAWTKAFSQAGEHESTARAKYIALRFDALAQVDLDEIRESNKLIEEEIRVFKEKRKRQDEANKFYKYGVAGLGRGIIGTEMQPDLPVAFKWFMKAVDLGSIEAYYMLGQFYEQGIVVKKDFEKAMGYYERAVLGGVEAAINKHAALKLETEKTISKTAD